MKRRRLLVVFALLLISSGESFAQGHFVRHGFQVTMPEFAVGANRSTLAFRVGYHVYGVVELGLGLERRSDFDADIVTMSLAPGVGVYPFRQSGSAPVTVRVGATYENQALSGDPITALEERDILTDGSAWRLEASVSRRYSLRRSVFGRAAGFVPIVSFAYRSIEIDQGEESSTDEFLTIALEMLLEIDAGAMARIVAGPRVGVFDDAFGAGLTFSLVAGYGY
ncbi:MAG: hypothetical protein BMS9Abin05_2191 [Rhodothermia bacterium]|nr:MAG: hypothetical protein BMS9Abin05_2191 [Rhodothermia bacterium]